MFVVNVYREKSVDQYKRQRSLLPRNQRGGVHPDVTGVVQMAP